MKNFAAFLFCGVLAAFSARAETVVTTTTTTTTTTTSGNVAANVTYTPSVVTYAPAVSRVIVNPQAGEDELYHRHLPAPRFYGSPVLAVGAGAAAPSSGTAVTATDATAVTAITAIIGKK